MSKSNVIEIKAIENVEILNPEQFQKINLRDVGLDEKWLQRYLGENPQALGLSDKLEFVSGERIQPKGGRLDLLFDDPKAEKRYCVEVMLGEMDPSHIIRTIEYWDNERSRPGADEHIAVLVAEGVSNHRYLGVISIIAKAVPMIVIQMNTFKVEDKIAVSFSRILDHTDPLYYKADENEAQADVTRLFWENRGSDSAMKTADLLYKITRAIDPKARLKYNRHHIAVGPAVGSNFMWLNPRKGDFCLMRIWCPDDKRKKVEQLLSQTSCDWKMNNYDEYQAPVELKFIEGKEQLWTEIFSLCVEGVKK